MGLLDNYLHGDFPGQSDKRGLLSNLGVIPQAATSESFQPVMQRVFDKIGVGNKVGQDNILKAIDTMSEIETNKQDIPNALGSSARGYFQYMVGNGCSEYATNAEGDSYCPKENKGTSENPVFKNSSFNTALNRVDNFYEKHNLGPVPEAFKEARRAKTPMDILTYEEQRLLAFIDAYAKKGTNAFFQRMSKGGDDGRKAIDEYYKEYHLTTAGTGGTQATETDKNRNKIITNKSNLIYNRNEPD